MKTAITPELSPLKTLLHTLIKLSKKDMDQRFSRAGIPITPLQFWVLKATEQESITLNEIAKRFNFSPPSLIPVVDALEKQHYLQRKDDPIDRRKVQLLITKKGQELIYKVPQDDKNDSLNIAFNKLSQTKRKHLLELLQELSNNI
jgi:DNA-binding MarR family transcriptional regulator